MHKNKIRTGYGLRTPKLKPMQAIAVALAAILLVTLPIFLVTKLKSRANNEKREILYVWNMGDFRQVFEMSRNVLDERPLDYFFLTINGFAAYQLGISQINNHNTLVYMDKSIRSLRKALLQRESVRDGRVFYVLGKAYTYKGVKYSDLAIKYLEKARELSFDASDISEYLGLAYAAIGDYRSSVEAFTRALSSAGRPSDALLLSIARSYIALNEFNMAKAYLMHCIDISYDAKSVLTARLLLAQVFMETGEYSSAENLFVSILNENGTNAEVHFLLGELHNIKGDIVRARSEWRLAHRADPAHARARARLNI